MIKSNAPATELAFPSRMPRPLRFTVEGYHRLGEAGILSAEDRIELIEGELIQMAPIGNPHFVCVLDLSDWFNPRVAGRARVSVQGPVRLSRRSEPLPDLALLRLRPDGYRTGLPAPADVLLLIEVADSTFRYDRGRKLPMYARAGIAEVWIVDLRRARVLVFRAPVAGRYTEAVEVTRGGVLSPLAFPDLVLPVEVVLGPAPAA